jgi:phage tail-like protein
MSFNTDYIYNNLPARMRRDDEELFLKRFLSFSGETLDGFEEALDTFHQRLAPETASEEYIEWWLYSFFGWAWFPTWFTLDLKRAFYADIAMHYARRGTPRGIQEFLAAFGVPVIVETEPQVYGDFAWGEDTWLIDGPLGLVVRLLPEAAAIPDALSFWGDFLVGESVLAEPGDNLQRIDVDELLRFQQPLSQLIMVESLGFPQAEE